MHVSSKTFQSRTRSWDDLRQDAAQFASSVGRDNLITITVVLEAPKGILTVWYWSEGDSEGAAAVS
jgi:hypothetical protein